MYHKIKVTIEIDDQAHVYESQDGSIILNMTGAPLVCDGKVEEYGTAVGVVVGAGGVLGDMIDGMFEENPDLEQDWRKIRLLKNPGKCGHTCTSCNACDKKEDAPNE